MTENQDDKPMATIIPFRINNVKEDFYTIDDLINSPLSVYGVFWTIKNVLMHLSSEAANGIDVTEDLKEYYFYDLPEKEMYDITLIRHIHKLMANTLKEMASYPDSSIDAMIAETMYRFKE